MAPSTCRSGSPCDPPSPAVMAALAAGDDGGATRGYPCSAGSLAARQAAADWMARRFGTSIDPGLVALCIGTKELVAGLPHWLHLRDPSRDTVLYPELAYPTYEMGALLAGLRAVPVPVDEEFRLRLSDGGVSESDAQRALLLWVNSPGNPAGQLDDLAAAADWGRQRGVLVASDECYAELTWKGEPTTVLGCGGGADGTEGVLAVHSLSKRSNLAGLRFGWYTGDADVVTFVRDVRQHAGFMVPGRGPAGRHRGPGRPGARRRSTGPVPAASGTAAADPHGRWCGGAPSRGRDISLGAGAQWGRLGAGGSPGGRSRAGRFAWGVLRPCRGWSRKGGCCGPHGPDRAGGLASGSAIGPVGAEVVKSASSSLLGWSLLGWWAEASVYGPVPPRTSIRHLWICKAK